MTSFNREQATTLTSSDTSPGELFPDTRRMEGTASPARPTQFEQPTQLEQDTDHGPTFVVGYDFSATSRDALEEALTYCALVPQCRLHVVWAPMALLSDQDLDPNSPSSAAASLNQAVDDQLQRHRPVTPRDLAIHLHLLDGLAATALLRLADAVKADAIIVGHDNDKAMKSELGSVAAEVIRRARCPVWVAHAGVTELGKSTTANTRSEQEEHAAREATSRLTRRDANFPLTTNR